MAHENEYKIGLNFNPLPHTKYIISIFRTNIMNIAKVMTV